MTRVLNAPKSRSPRPQDLVEEARVEQPVPGNAVDALLKTPPPPTPPHTEKKSDLGIEFEQAIAGYEQASRRFAAFRAWHDTLAAIIAGTQRPSIITWPTGGKNEEDEQILIEIDLEVMLKDCDETTQRQWLTVLYNYSCIEYKRWLGQTAKYAQAAFQLLS